MHEFTITRHLPAPRGAVWTAWTDPAELGSWFWPERFHAIVTASAQVGGRWRVASKPMDMAASGTYTAVEKQHLLDFTFTWDADDAITQVTVTLEDAADGGTTMTLVHSGIDSEADAASLEQGWHDCLDRLPHWLARVASRSASSAAT